MKRFFISIAILGPTVCSFAQAEPDAYRLSKNDLKGTARSVGMGGAFGAVGGDISGISINPAGLGAYRSSEVVATMNFSNETTKAELNAGQMEDKKFKFNFDNIAYVGAFPLGNRDVPFLNFGFSYNRLKNFDRKISTKGNNLPYSLTNFIAGVSNGYSPGQLDNSGSYNPFENVNWLSALAYNQGLITPKNDGKNGWNSFLGGDVNNENSQLVNNSSYLREEGYIGSYEFSIGTNISRMLSLGLTFALTDVDYRLYSDYSEQFSGNNYFALENVLKTEGSGFQVKAGLIFTPVKELRLGVSYHSPTWYDLTDRSYAIISSRDGGTINTADSRNAGVAYYDYELETPDKWTFSLAGVIANRATVSVDYELTNYGNMTLKDDIGIPYSDINQYIDEDFRTSSALRVGAEVYITPQFSGRVGYSWVQSPFSKSISDQEYPELVTAGTTTQFTIDGDTNYFTWGLGYEFTRSFYGDIAFVIRNQTDDYYSYPMADKVKLKTNTFGGLLTFGYRF